jgi:PTS system mannose-specific IIC component
MHISLLQAVGIGMLYYLANSPWLAGLGYFTVYRPLVGGTLVGLFLGDPVQGAIIGGTINLIYLGFISAGGSLPGDPALAGILCTALAIASKLTPQEALAMAVPVGLTGTLIWFIKMTLNSVFVHWADRYAELGETRKVMLMNVVPPQILLFIISFFPVFFASLYGPQAVQAIIGALSGKALHVFIVIGGILPALGIALNLKFIGRGFAFVFFFLGFFLIEYLKLDIVAVAIFMTIITVILYNIDTDISKSKGGETNGRS